MNKATMWVTSTAVGAALFVFTAVAEVTVPSVVTSDAIFWLDASDLSSIVLDASGNVTNWKSRVGANFAKPSTASGFKCPKYEELAFDVPTVDFGDVGSNTDMLVNSRPSNVRMAFLVVKIVNSANAYWIGDTSTEFYKRGANGTYSSSTYVTNMWNGYDQVNMTADTPDDTKFNIITMAMKSNCGVGSLTRDRSQAGRNGGRQLSELILFSRYLTNDEREAVVGYLEEKWVDKKVLECSLAVSRTDEAVEFSRDGGGTWSSSLDISSSLPVEVTIRAKNDMTAGCFFEWSGLPPDAVFSDNLHTAVTVLLKESDHALSALFVIRYDVLYVSSESCLDRGLILLIGRKDIGNNAYDAFLIRLLLHYGLEGTAVTLITLCDIDQSIQLGFLLLIDHTCLLQIIIQRSHLVTYAEQILLCLFLRFL